MKRQKRKYSRPLRPWNKPRIESEKALMIDYGLRKKMELWKAESMLSEFRGRARNLQALKNETEEKHLIGKLVKLGLLKEEASLDDVLALETTDLLNRRLQTIVHKKGFANSADQARQFIVHGHIAVDGIKARWPSTLVSLAREEKISYYGKSKVKDVVISQKDK